MRNLLSANLHRLRKSRVFWVCEAVSVLYALFLSCVIYLDMKINGFDHCLDTGLFQYAIFAGIMLAVFCSLFLGPELGDGFVRNKVVAGHRKSHIYLADLVICSIASLLFTFTYLAAYLAPSVFFLLPLEADLATVLKILFGSLALNVAYCAVYTLISMLCANKAVVSTICLLLAFVLFFSGIAIKQGLDEPETFEILEYDEETKEAIYTGEIVPNSEYLSSFRRSIYEFLYDFLPGGQGLQYSGMMEMFLSFNWKLPLYSFCILIITTGAGLIIFTKKDLN